MGVQFALNLLTAFPKCNREEFTVASDTASSWVDSGNKLKMGEAEVDLQQPQWSMDKLLEECSRDTIRNTMLKHEKLFKEQVDELHRLYRVQKLLMDELSKELRFHHVATTTSRVDSHSRSGFLSSATNSGMSHSPSSTDRSICIPPLNPVYNFNKENDLNAGTSSLGPSACCGETSRIQIGFDLARPTLEVLPKPVFSRQSNGKMRLDTPLLCNDEEGDLELTLSIGCAASRKKSRERPRSGLGSGPAASNSDENRHPAPSNVSRMQQEERSEHGDSEGLQRPPWLIQALSLNRT